MYFRNDVSIYIAGNQISSSHPEVYRFYAILHNQNLFCSSSTTSFDVVVVVVTKKKKKKSRLNEKHCASLCSHSRAVHFIKYLLQDEKYVYWVYARNVNRFQHFNLCVGKFRLIFINLHRSRMNGETHRMQANEWQGLVLGALDYTLATTTTTMAIKNNGVIQIRQTVEKWELRSVQRRHFYRKPYGKRSKQPICKANTHKHTHSLIATQE